jgi:hypothetical protein
MITSKIGGPRSTGLNPSLEFALNYFYVRVVYDLSQFVKCIGLFKRDIGAVPRTFKCNVIRSWGQLDSPVKIFRDVFMSPFLSK